jgi:signal transduction histidine kinase
VPDALPEVSLSAELRHNVFLAFEEALSNVLQHAGAARVRVEMRMKPDAFEICVHDDGGGFDRRTGTVSLPGHDGLRNMRDRLRAVGGACSISSEQGNGTTVSLRFPLSGETVATGITGTSL